MRYFLGIMFTAVVMIAFAGGQRQGDLCVMAGTIQPGVCRHIMRCSAVLEAAFQGIPYQVCASPENRLIVCCPWVPAQETGLQARCQANTTIPREGDNCTMMDTGRAGVCSQFSNCQAAIEAASKGQSPQICAVEGTTRIVCCPLVIVAEGDKCSTVTGRTGKCLRISKCPVAVEAALKGKTPQICVLDGSVPVVCCEGVFEGDNCNVVDTGKAGVCRPFANCQTAKEAANKGILPQACDVEGSVQAVCCPPSTIVEGSNCTMMDTGRVGVCRSFANCQTAKEASYNGTLPQTCDVEGTVQAVCCPPSTIVEGSVCTVKNTRITGVYKPFANCQTAMMAASEGTLPQISALDDDIQIVCCPLVVEGSNCTLMDTGMAGVCKSFANCRRAKKAAGRGVAPQKCDLTDNESELVCCAETDCPPLPKGLITQLPVGSKAADYCIELAEKIHPCQETRSGWTRGDLCPLLTPDSNILYHYTPMTTAAEAPYFGLIGAGQRGDITWRAYGSVSLVSDQWVLCSAAAIIVSIGSGNVKFVGLGGTFTPRYNPDEIYGVITQHIHPLYNDSYSYSYNSIALLQLDRRVTFTARILPACLHTGTPLPDSGFILTGWDGSSGHKTTMQRVSQEECSRAFPTGSYRHPAGVKHDQEICSRPVNTTGGCPGWIYGFPLTLQNSHRVACTHLLVGLTSYRESCIFTNTRISSFIPWIEGIVWT